VRISEDEGEDEKVETKGVGDCQEGGQGLAVQLTRAKFSCNMILMQHEQSYIGSNSSAGVVNREIRSEWIRLSEALSTITAVHVLQLTIERDLITLRDILSHTQ
jgi:hypothetical protein